LRYKIHGESNSDYPMTNPTHSLPAAIAGDVDALAPVGVTTVNPVDKLGGPENEAH